MNRARRRFPVRPLDRSVRLCKPKPYQMTRRGDQNATE